MKISCLSKFLLRLGALSLVGLLFALPAFSAPSQRHRVIVSSDIGGTDPDDYQSMVHLLLYADTLDIEGLIASPFGEGRKQTILNVIDLYEQDFPNLSTYSPHYPSPQALRNITKQGEVDVAPYPGYRKPTEGSQWIIERARAKDPRPLYLLVWGGIEDLAQALHDAPDILPKLRVYYIGGPNKKWTPDAYQYIADNHPNLWIIEANATYRGWFVGGNQSGDLGNNSFVTQYAAGRGALGEYFASHLGGTIKMGDTPSVAKLLHGNPSAPSEPSWGGQFVRAWARPHQVFHRLTTENDQIEEFGIFDLILPLGSNAPAKPEARLVIENQTLAGFIDDKGAVHFRFSPKAAKVFSYAIKSNIPDLDGKSGALTAMPTRANQAVDEKRPHWWVDDPAPENAEGPHIGAKTVNRWREDYLRDFAQRLQRCQSPAPASKSNQP